MPYILCLLMGTMIHSNRCAQRYTESSMWTIAEPSVDNPCWDQASSQYRQPSQFKESCMPVLVGWFLQIILEVAYSNASYGSTMRQISLESLPFLEPIPLRNFVILNEI